MYACDACIGKKAIGNARALFNDGRCSVAPDKGHCERPCTVPPGEHPSAFHVQSTPYASCSMCHLVMLAPKCHDLHASSTLLTLVWNSGRKDLEEVLHLVHDTSLVISQAMVICAAQHGEKAILSHMERHDEPESRDRSSALCIHELHTTMNALNHTCHEMAVDLDVCSKDHFEKEQTGLVSPGHCKMHLESTSAELADAEDDMDHAIKECEKPDGEEEMSEEEILEIAEHLHPELAQKYGQEEL